MSYSLIPFLFPTTGLLLVPLSCCTAPVLKIPTDMQTHDIDMRIYRLIALHCLTCPHMHNAECIACQTISPWGYRLCGGYYQAPFIFVLHESCFPLGLSYSADCTQANNYRLASPSAMPHRAFLEVEGRPPLYCKAGKATTLLRWLLAVMQLCCICCLQLQLQITLEAFAAIYYLCISTFGVVLTGLSPEVADRAIQL